MGLLLLWRGSLWLLLVTTFIAKWGTATSSAATTKHLHLISDYFGYVTFVAVPIIVGAILDAAFYIDLFPFV